MKIGLSLYCVEIVAELQACLHKISPFSSKFPALSRLAGNFRVETGSDLAATTTTHSHSNRVFRRFVN